MTTNVRSWIVESIGEVAFERLANELTGSELQSLLLEVLQRRARRRVPKQVASQYESDRFCMPASVDQRTSLAIDQQLLAAAEGFALRATEVVSDPTNAFALECARRLRVTPQMPVHLVTSQRVLRTQPVPKFYRGHVVVAHTYGARWFGAARATGLWLCGAQCRRARHRSALQRGRACGGGARTTGAVQAARACLLLGGLRCQIWVTAPDGARLPLVDGGAFDWLAKLTSNRRAVFVASGAGAQLIALRFRVPEAMPKAGG